MAVSALADSENPQIVPYLKQIALTAKDEELVQAALRGLGQFDNRRGGGRPAADPEGIQVHRAPGPTPCGPWPSGSIPLSVAALRDLALNDPDSEIRRTAVMLIGERKDPQTFEALKGILAAADGHRSPQGRAVRRS